jgi:6-pyruvoyltetrahydropterin/6-carboxytetrahydropterin synthase
LEASIAGSINDSTGMVINIKDLDAIMRERIVSRFDQVSINDDIAEFADTSPSLENIAMFAASELRELPGGVWLHRIRLHETPTLWAEYDCRENQMTITRVYEFCASHRLYISHESDARNYELFGKCTNPNGHGHNYELEVSVTGPIDRRNGMSVDIDALDAVVMSEVVDRYDHKHLNLDIEEFRGKNPTSEVVTKTIWSRLCGTVPAKLKKIVLRETRRNVFEYEGEDE